MAEHWVELFKSSGQAADQQCEELDRYLSCPVMSGGFCEGVVKLRWTLDRVTGMLVDADALGAAAGFKWPPMSDGERGELQAFLEDTDAASEPERVGAHAVQTLPDWSAAAPKPPASDIVAFLDRKQAPRGRRAPRARIGRCSR